MCKKCTVDYKRLKRAYWSKERWDEHRKVGKLKCEICSKQTIEAGRGSHRDRACADHCHETNTPRGIICSGCNKALGFAKDNPDTLRAMIEYLEKYQSL